MLREIHALLPRFFSKLGHIFHYHIAVEKAFGRTGWSYKAYIPKKIGASDLPSNWIQRLANDTREKPKGGRQKLAIFFANILPFRSIFQDIEKKKEAVLFIEHFEFQHLASMLVALSFLKPQFQFWILHRYELENRRVKAFLIRVFLAYMRKKLGAKRVRCLTDSELLAESLEKDLRCPVQVVPIPHTEGKRESIKREPKLQFWWPGGLIREDKGLSKIRRLLLLLAEQKEIRLVVAESARSSFGSHGAIDYIPTCLSREEYISWMQRVSIVLLPYSGIDYSKRTSGIFVESVVFGAIPVTTRGTWMAYELNKFALSELILDWEESDLLDRLMQVVKNQAVLEKLEVMRAHYSGFHCLEKFSLTFQKVFEEAGV